MNAVLESELQDDRAAAERLATREAEMDKELRRLQKKIRTDESEANKILRSLEAGEESTPALTERIEDLAEAVEHNRLDVYALIAMATDYQYDAHTVRGWYQRAVAMDCALPRVERALLGDLLHLRQIPNALLRERYEELVASGKVTGQGVARRAHLHLAAMEAASGEDYGSSTLVRDGGKTPDATRLERLLGVQKRTNAKGGSLKLYLSYEQAVAISRALYMSPTEAGI